MPEELSISEDGNQIDIRSYGQISKKDLEQALEKVDQIHHERGITKVLVDARERNHPPDTMTAFDGAVCLAERFRAKIRFAIVVRRDMEANKLFESVATNRGARIAYFKKLESALEWLWDDESDKGTREVLTPNHAKHEPN